MACWVKTARVRLVHWVSRGAFLRGCIFSSHLKRVVDFLIQPCARLPANTEQQIVLLCLSPSVFISRASLSWPFIWSPHDSFIFHQVMPTHFTLPSRFYFSPSHPSSLPLSFMLCLHPSSPVHLFSLLFFSLSYSSFFFGTRTALKKDFLCGSTVASCWHRKSSSPGKAKDLQHCY